MLRRLGPTTLGRGIGMVMIAGVCGCAAAPAAAPGPVGWTQLLALRAHALLSHDAPALARTAAPSATRGVRTVGARTAALPLAQVSYTAITSTAGPGRSERTVRTTLHYRLGVDRADVTATRVLILVDTGPVTGWRLVSDEPVGAGLPWDLGTLTYAQGRHGAAMTTTGSAATLATATDQATTAVSRVWGTSWSQAPVVVGVDGAADLARITGRTPAGVAGLVAVSTPARVYVDLTAYAGLTTAGRQVLLTHEVTHVATAAGTDRAVPQWLEEGFADYVGFLGSGIGTDVAAATLLARVRRDGPPPALPTDSAFDPAVPPAVSGYTPGDAYAAAWLACSLVAAKVGPDGLVRVYRLASAGSGAEAADVDAALRSVTGEPLAWWTRAWRADLRTLAAPAGSATVAALTEQ